MEDVVVYTTVAKLIAVAIIVACAAAAVATGQSRIGATGCENIGKYPESSSGIRGAMIGTIVLIETIFILSLLLCAGVLIYM